MKEKEKQQYQAPTLKKLGEVSQITAGGAFSPPEDLFDLKESPGKEEFKEG